MKKSQVLLLMMVALLSLFGEIRVLDENSYNIRFQIDTSDYIVKENPEFSIIELEDWSADAIAGAPNLPHHTIYIAVPVNGDIKINLISSETEMIQLNKPIEPIPTIIPGDEFAEFHYEMDESYYLMNRDLFFVGSKTSFRHHTVIPITFSPFQYNAANLEITHYFNLQFDVKIMGDTKLIGDFVDPFLDKYPEMILNYESARNWTSITPKNRTKMPFSTSDFWYKIKIEDGGIFVLDYSTLSTLPEFADLDQLRLYSMNHIHMNRTHMMDNEPNDKRKFLYQVQEIPLYIVQDEEPGISVDDFVYFETKVNNVLYESDQTQYCWLTFGVNDPEPPSRLTELSDISSAKLVMDIKRKVFQKKFQQNSKSREELNSVIVYPEIFLTQAQRLADIHLQNLEINSLLVSQEDCFDTYSGGAADPASIEDALEVIFDEHPELTHVVLMGSGIKTWNPSHEKNKIITYSSTPNNPETGFAKDDNFINFNSSSPQLAIGRIPAKNETMLNYYLDRVQDYIENPNMGWWRNNFLLVADDEKRGDAVETVGGLDHTYLSEQTEKVFHEGINVTKVYGLEFDYDAFQNKPDGRDKIVEELNKGALIWYYIGHGNPNSLGHETYFKSPEDIALLENSDKLCLFLAASCSVGLFDDLNYDCMSEELLFSGLSGYVGGDGGSIASIAASDASSGGANTDLMKDFLGNILDYRNDIGVALLRAKLLNDTLNSRKYNILGDPHLPILFPDVSGNIQNWPDSIRARETISINGNLGEDGDFESEFHMFESDKYIRYEYLEYKVAYKVSGDEFVLSPLQHEDGLFEKTFIVPDDAQATKHIKPLIDFYYPNGSSIAKGFIIEGDQSFEYLNRFPIYLKSPASNQYTTIDSSYVRDGNTVLRFHNTVNASFQGVDAFNIFVDAWAKAVVYSYDPLTNREILTFTAPIQLSDDRVNVVSEESPQISIYLDSPNFNSGDVVSTKPLLIAVLEDENGINLLSSSGHGIQLLLDNSGLPIDITEGFVYYNGSYKKGEVSWQMDEISEGHHTIKIIAFDSFNNPTVAEVDFIAKKSGKVYISKMLPYPNPMEKGGDFTFTITEPANITLTIYTITGKKIRTLKKNGCEVNFNMISWDGKDAEGDELANGTYLYKIRAKGLDGSKSSESMGKVIILK